MPDTVNVHTELIRIETEQSSADETTQRVRAIRDVVRRARDETTRLGDAASKTRKELGAFGSSADRTRARYASLRQELRSDIDVLSDLRVGFDDVAESEQRASDNVRSFGRLSSATRDISQAAGVVGGGAVAGPLNAAAQLIEVNRAAELLRDSLPSLVDNLNISRVQLGAMGIAAAGAALLFKAISDARKEEEERLRKLTEATRDYLIQLVELEDFLLDTTLNDIRARREQTEREVAGAQAGLDALRQQQLDLQTQILGQIAPSFIDELAGELLPIDELIDLAKSFSLGSDEIKEMIAQLSALDDVIDDSTSIIDEGTREIDILNQAIGEMATEAGGVAAKFGEAEKAIRDTSDAIEVSGVGKTGFREPPLRKQARPGFVDSLGGNVAEAAAQALIAVNAKVADSDAELVKAQEAAAKTTDKLAKLTDKYNLALKREAEDFALERTRDLADHYGELAEIDRDFYSEREDILADVSADLADINKDRIKEARTINRDLQRLAKDHRDRMFRIERDSRRDLLRAARRLDGIAAFDARQAKKDALEDENQQFVDEKDRREEDFQDRVRELDEQRSERQQAGMDALRDLEDQHRQERSAKVLDFRLRLAREDEDRAIRLSRLRQDHIAQRNELLKNFANQIGLTNQHYGTMLAITQFGMQGVTGLILTEWLNLQSQLVPTQAQGAQGVGGGFRDFPGSVDVNVQGDGVIADMVKQVMVDVFERF